MYCRKGMLDHVRSDSNGFSQSEICFNAICPGCLATAAFHVVSLAAFFLEDAHEALSSSL